MATTGFMIQAKQEEARGSGRQKKRQKGRIQGASWAEQGSSSQGGGGHPGSRRGPEKPHQSDSSSRRGDEQQPQTGGGRDHDKQPLSGGERDHDKQPLSGGERDHDKQPLSGGERDHDKQPLSGGERDHDKQPLSGGERDHDKQPLSGGERDHDKQPLSGRGRGRGFWHQDNSGRGRGGGQRSQSGRGRSRGRGCVQQDQSDRGRDYEQHPQSDKGREHKDQPQSGRGRDYEKQSQSGGRRDYEKQSQSGGRRDYNQQYQSGGRRDNNQQSHPGGRNSDQHSKSDRGRTNHEQHSTRGGDYKQHPSRGWGSRSPHPQGVQFGSKGRGPRQSNERHKFTFQAPTEHIPVPTKAKDRVIEEEGRYVLSKEPSGESVVEIFTDFLTSEEADRIFNTLLEEVDWKQQINKNRAGEDYKEPREVCWYGEHPYAYSKVQMKANMEWPPELLKVREKIEEKAKTNFNSVLCNKYRDERDGVAWHSDDEYGLRDQPTIASLSLGEERMFEMRKKPSKYSENPRDYSNCEKLKIPLTHGSFLIMSKHTQDDWQHQVPKEYHRKGMRINLTFRNIYPDERFERAETKAQPGGKGSSSREGTTTSSNKEETKTPLGNGGTTTSLNDEKTKMPSNWEGTTTSSNKEETKAPSGDVGTTTFINEEETVAPLGSVGTTASSNHAGKEPRHHRGQKTKWRRL